MTRFGCPISIRGSAGKRKDSTGTLALMTDEKVLKVAELASILGVHPQTVYAKASELRPTPEGCIPGFRVGRAWRFYLSEVRDAGVKQHDPWALPSGRPRRFR
ncbi:helix-turn-helix domain-containing protein [Agromyces sp. NPDC057679]|uniref:helix-turn-helix domain-containing protein n=1 Tax=Agromyces sp. NPDC057679 TaxID=3346207 RepID=UPI00366FAA25